MVHLEISPPCETSLRVTLWVLGRFRNQGSFLQVVSLGHVSEFGPLISQ